MDEIIVPKPLTEQVLDEMFADIGKHPEFDAQIIENLKRLASKGDLKKSPQVTHVVKSAQRGKS